MSPQLFVVCFVFFIVNVQCRDAGILYEVWHTKAAQQMKKVQQLGGLQLTTEAVIRSNGLHTLNDVYSKYGLNGDIWNVKPNLGFYCLYRHRPNDPTPPVPDCDNITGTAQEHAKMLVAAGFDYVTVDITNWPTVNTDTDVAVLRPTEVLFEEWANLRKAGITTPQITVWPCSPSGASTWQFLLNNLYNNPLYEDLVFKIDGKKVVFLPDNPTCYNAQEEQLILSNGGRNDITTIKMWALFGQNSYKTGSWGFFTPCTASSNPSAYTTSIIGEGPCNQFETTDPQDNIVSISASGSYMVSQCALPFASPGHLRGLTLQRLFQRILRVSPPHIFMSSFNEHIGGRQASAYTARIAFNMGLPTDPQRGSVWVDTYGSEFSRDVEPSVEAGTKVWLVTGSCVRLYKAGKRCEEVPLELCCTVQDKEVFQNVWSLVAPGEGDHLLTTSQYELEVLVAAGWKQICSPINGPSVFCVDTADQDGRNGPFILYNLNSSQAGLIPLFRCINPQTGQHYFSTDGNCEGQKTESTLGYIATQRGGETLRALRRCKIQKDQNGAYTPRHALDLECDVPDTGILGYVR